MPSSREGQGGHVGLPAVGQAVPAILDGSLCRLLQDVSCRRYFARQNSISTVRWVCALFDLSRCLWTKQGSRRGGSLRCREAFASLALHRLVQKLSYHGRTRCVDCYSTAIKGLCSHFLVSAFSPIQSALMSSDAAHLFRVMPLLTSLLALPHISNAGLSTSNIPYRLTKAAQSLKGLPEGVMVGDIGSPSEVEKQVPTISQYLTRCLDRAARLVAI